MRAWGWRQFSQLTPVMLIVVITAVGCGSLADQPPQNAKQQLPFTENKPFIVPANTVIYVRLRESITSATARTGQGFAAVLDDPLLVADQTIAPQGADVTGTVVAARQSGRLNTAGYVRITLSSITLNGKTFTMQTNSALAGGGNIKNRGLGFAFLRGGTGGHLSNSFQSADSSAALGKNEVGFAADSRIGFRLTQPLTIN
jgi:hypothetical protein